MTTDDGADLSVIDTGRGRPIVILPAWTNSASEYHSQIDEFSTNHRVIALDMRGHGLSAKIDRGYTIDRFALDLKSIIEAFSLTNFTLMGHSMGCSVIWCYLDMFKPGNVHSLVLVDQAAVQICQPHWSPGERLSYGCIQTLDELRSFCAALAGPDGENITRSMFAGIFSKGFPRDRIEWIIDEILRMPRIHAAALMLDHAQRDWREVIRSIRIPSFVIGAQKSVFPAQSQVWIGQQIPNSLTVIFEEQEGGSHFMCFENPAKFNSAVLEFLESASEANE